MNADIKWVRLRTTIKAIAFDTQMKSLYVVTWVIKKIFKANFTCWEHALRTTYYLNTAIIEGKGFAMSYVACAYGNWGEG